MKKIALMYHDIYNLSTKESGFQNSTAIKYKVQAEVFENQVKEIAKYLKYKNLPFSTVEFTFDDGGVSFLTLAAPILEKYGFKGIFFIATSQIDKPGFLSKTQIIELRDRGHRIGSHSHSHPEDMSSLSQYEIIKEWQESQKIIADILGFPQSIASIPNGFYSKCVIKVMADAGIKEIYTSDPILKRSKLNNSLKIGRYAIIDSDSVNSVVDIITSPLGRLKKMTRFFVLGGAKAVLGDSYLKIRKKLLK